MLKIWKVTPATFLVWLSFHAMALAVNRTWLGSSGSNWSNSSNWSPAGIPVSTDTVIFNSGTNPCLIDVSSTVSNFNINPSYSGSITLPNGKFLTVSSFTMSGSSFTMMNGSSMTVIINFELGGGTFSAGNNEIRVGGNWHKAGTVNFQTGFSTVNFTGMNQKISGSNTFYGIRALTPGATLFFQWGATQTVTSMINFQNLTLKSDVDTKAWFLNFVGSSQTVKGVAVRDSHISGNNINPDGTSLDLSGNVNWNFPDTGVRFWVASAASNWSNTASWSATCQGPNGASVPTSSFEVVFDTNCGGNGNANIDASVTVATFSIKNYTGNIYANYNTITVNNLYFQKNGWLNLNGSTLNINGDMIKQGGSFTPGQSVVKLNGPKNVVAGNFDFNNLKVLSPGSTVYFSAGSTITVATGLECRYSTLRSTQDAANWKLGYWGSSLTIAGCFVQDSDARPGYNIVPDFATVDGGNNLNWDFPLLDPNQMDINGMDNGFKNGDVAFGDMNNDGYLDIVVMGEDSNPTPQHQMKVFINNGDGTFNSTSYSIDPTANNRLAYGRMALGDLNNDGKLDVVVTGIDGSGYKRIRYYRNNGNLTFASPIEIEPDPQACLSEGDVDLGDYDNDGDLDVLVMGLDGSAITRFRIYRNNGAGTFSPFINVVAGNGGFSNGGLSFGDYDNDGDLDILVNGYQSGYAQLQVFKNNGLDSFDVTPIDVDGTNGGLRNGDSAWGDFDNDGDLDIVVLGKDASNNQQLRVYKNQGNGSFDSIQIEIGGGIGGLEYGSVAWGDYDNDGLLDILAMGQSPSGPQLRIYKNNGSGGFLFTPIDVDGSGGGLNFGKAVFGDYDGDGDLDVLAMGQSGSYVPQLRVYKNIASATVPNTAPYPPNNVSGSFEFSESTYSRAVFKWDAGLDTNAGATPQNGLYYEVQAATSSDFGSPVIQSYSHQKPAMGNYLRPPKIFDGSTRYGVVIKSSAPWDNYSNLKTDSTYYFRVKSIDAGLRPSTYSPVGIINTKVPPGAIYNLGAQTGADAATVKLSWMAPGDNGWQGILNQAQYMIQFTTDVSFAGWNPTGNQPAHVQRVNISTGGVSPWTTTAVDVHGLLPASTYYFRVWTGDRAGNWSELSNGATAWAQVQNAPAWTSVWPIFVSSAVVDWAAMTPEKGFVVEASSDNFQFGAIISASTPGVNATEIILSGLSFNTTYFFRVGSLWNNGTTSYNFPQQGMTLAGVPDALEFAEILRSSITVTWDANGNPKGALYEAQISSFSSFQNVLQSSRTVLLISTFQSLDVGTSYYFRVHTISWNGTPSSFTAVACAATLPVDPPPYVNFNFPAEQGLGLTWGTPVPSPSYFVVELSTSSGFSPKLSTQTIFSYQWFDNLPVNTTYYGRVRSGLNSSLSDWLIAGATSTLAAQPSVVSSTWVSVGVTSATVTWGKGLNPGTVTKYIVEMSPDPGFSSQVYSRWTFSTTSYFDGLFPGTTYYAQVKALNQQGYPSSYRYLGSTQTLTSALPSGLRFIASSTSSLTAAWNIPSPPGDKYTVEIGTDSGFNVNSGSTVTTTGSFIFTGLNINEIYFSRINSIVGPSTSSWVLGASTATSVMTPLGVSSTWTGVGFSSLTVNWGQGDNPFGTGYDVHLSTDSGFIMNVIATGTAQSSFTFTGLEPGNTYWARVRAVNKVGVPTDFYYMSSTQTLSISYPPNLSFVAVSSTDLTAQWDVANPPADSYTLQVSPRMDFSSGVISMNGTGVSENVGSLAVNTTYWARVLSVIQGSSSSWSVSIPTATSAAIPSPAANSFSSVGMSSLTVSWTKGANPQGTVFNVELSSFSNYSLKFSSVTKNTQAQFTALPSGTLFYAQAQSLNLEGTPTEFTDLGSTKTLPVSSPSGFGFSGASMTYLSGWWGASTPPAENYIFQVAPTSNFDTGVVSSVTANLSGIIAALSVNTSYYGRVSAVLNGSTGPWTQTIATATLANDPIPASNSWLMVEKTSATLAWQYNGNPFYTVFSAEVSPDPSFNSGLHTLNVVSSSATFTDLSADTTYFSRVKAVNLRGTGSNYLTLTSTHTGIANPGTVLNPYFSFVGLDVLNVNWNYISGVSYTAVLSTDSSFASYVSSEVLNANSRNYATSISPDASYYFKVKVSTEPDVNFSLVIATRTQSAGGTGNFALKFSVANGKVVYLPSSANFDITNYESRTVEFWFKRSTNNITAEEFLVSKDNSGQSSGWAISLKDSPRRIRFQLFGGGGLTSSSTISDAYWHHVALTKDSFGNANLYIDGKWDSSGYTSGAMTNTYGLKLGNSESRNRSFDGTLDEVRIWNYTRSVSEINAQRYQHFYAAQGGLIGYWAMNEGTGQTVHDDSGLFFHGWLGLTNAVETSDPIWVTDLIPGFGAPPDTISPAVKISSPADGSNPTIQSLLIISGTAQDNQGLANVRIVVRRNSDGMCWNFSVSGTQGYWLATEAAFFAGPNANWTAPGNDVRWSTGTSYSIYAKADDTNFNSSVDTVTFTVALSTDIVLPTAGINFPVQNSTYSSSQLALLNGTANDNEAVVNVSAAIQRLADGKFWNKISLTWQTGQFINLADGSNNWSLAVPISAWDQMQSSYSLSVRSIDMANNMSSTATVNFSVNLATGTGQDNIPPSVFVVFPASGSVHPASALVSLWGTADDNNSLVETAVSIEDLNTVKYWDGANFNSSSNTWFSLATPRNWCFSSISQSKWVDGHRYLLTARAKDSFGNPNFHSVEFNIANGGSADTVPPSININVPISGGVYAPTAVNIAGYASDNVELGKVWVILERLGTPVMYFDNAGFNAGAPMLLPASGLSNWSFTIPSGALGNGSYQLVAIASDTSGLLKNSTVTFTVSGATVSSDVTAPTLRIRFPENLTIFTSADFNSLTQIYGTAADNVGVVEVNYSLKDDNNVYWNGAGWTSSIELWQPSTGTNEAWQGYIPLNAWKNGNFLLRARARDQANNIVYDSVNFSISGSSGTGQADSVPPNNYINNPPQSAIQGPQTFTHLNGHTDDSFVVSEVKLSLLNATIGKYWTGSGFNSDTEFLIFPYLIQNDPSNMDWYYDLPVSAYSNGSYLLQVKAKDNSNNQSVATSSFSVIGAGQGAGDLTPPEVGIVHPANPSPYTYDASSMTAIWGTAWDNLGLSGVWVRIIKNSQFWDGAHWTANEVWLGAENLAPWTFRTSTGVWSDGDYNLAVKVKDLAGNERIDSKNITVLGAGTGGTPPTVKVTFPVSDATYIPANLTSVFGTASGDATHVYVHIRDVNLMMEWNPIAKIWQAASCRFEASLAAGVWSSTQTPAWSQGRFRVMAEAENSLSLVAAPDAKEFNVNAGGGTGGDFTPPATVTDLKAYSGPNPGSVRLTWTETGDNGASGQAQGYIVKYRSDVPILTEADWISAMDISVPPVNMVPPLPSAAGIIESLIVPNLNPGVGYFWAVKVRDAANNKSTISNSPMATAFSGNIAGGSDGEGTASIVPSTFSEMTMIVSTLTFTVGAGGITPGGKVDVKVPDGWMFPQTWGPASSGYVSTYSNNPTVTLSLGTLGQVVSVSLLTGSLNQGDKIYLIYLAQPACGVSGGVQFKIMSQGSSYGVSREIASQPTVSVVKGAASWLGFENYEKFVSVNQSTAIVVKGQNSCGAEAAVSANVPVNVSAVVWNSNLGQWADDPLGSISLFSNMSASAKTKSATVLTGNSSATLYYLLTSDANRGQNRIKISYTDLRYGSYTNENMLNIVPQVAGAGLSNLSVDNGTTGGNLKQVTITLDGDGINDFAFINFTLGDPMISWHYQISSDNFVTVLRDEWGSGSPARRSWDGRRMMPTNDVVPPGVYQIKVMAGGMEDKSLSVIVQAIELKGQVVNSTTSIPVPDAYVNVYGPIVRNSQTDSQGKFSLVGLPQGTYQLRIDKESYAPYQNNVVLGSSTLNLGTISLKPFSKVEFLANRTDSISEVWGRIRAVGNNEEFSCSVHYGIGRTSPDNGMTGVTPELLLKSGVSYSITAEVDGYPLQTLTKTFSEGEVYNWAFTMNPKGGISGILRLGNGLVNQFGFPISLAAGLDANQDGVFDAGVPSVFAQAYLAPFESQTSYSFRGMNDGKYLVTMNAPGYSPAKTNVTIANNIGIVADFALVQNGNLDVNLQFAGDTNFLSPGMSTFPVTVRIQSSSGYSAALSSGVVKKTVSTNGILRFTGVPDGTFAIYADKVDGFALTPPVPKTAVVNLGTGTVNLNFTRYLGSIVGTVIGSSINDLKFNLTNGLVSFSTPTILANPFEFRNLESGWYNLSVNDSVSGASDLKQIFVNNGLPSAVTLNFATQNYFTVSGTVRTIAAPPYQSLSSIVDNSSAAIVYDADGNPLSLNALRVEAYLVNTDNSTDPLPTTVGSRLNFAKVKYALVDPASGYYQIAGLKQGTPYKLRINTDLNNDGQADIPLEEKLVTLFGNQQGTDFTIRSGGSILGTISSPVSDNGHAMTVTLTDADLNTVARTLAVSLVGNGASFSFTNLRVGRYLVQIVDSVSPAAYATKPLFVSLDTDSGSQSVSFILTKGASIRGKLADQGGQLITSQNSSVKLPPGFKISLVGQGHATEAAGPDADGTYSADVIPNLNYSVIIKPPVDQSAGLEGKGFLPVTLQGKAGVGEVYDWGTVILEPGLRVTGSVEDAQGNGKSHIVVLAYQSLSRSLEPLKIFTNEAGDFAFDGLDPKVRFYDFVANKSGHADARPDWSEGGKTMVDITKPDQIQNLLLQISLLTAGVKGKVAPAAGVELKVGFGEKAGWPGASIVITRRSDGKILEFVTATDGSFNIPLGSGGYDLEVISQGHKVYPVTVDVNNAAIDLGNIALEAGAALSGNLRNSDDSLPTQNQVSKVLAIDAGRNIFRANLTVENVTQSVDHYAFSGLTPGKFTIIAVDKVGRPRILRDQFDLPAQDTVLDLTFTVSEPQLVASFIQKLPDGVEAIFGCNQAFRNNPDDLDADGTPDDNEFANFISVTQGNGTLAFTNVDADRHKASYLYTMGNETGVSALKLAATYKTEEINPQSGQNYIVQGTFTHPFGLQSAQEDVVTNLGGEFSLPGGSGLNFPSNWSADSNLNGVIVKFQAADSVEGFAGEADLLGTKAMGWRGQGLRATGAGAKALAKKLGPAFYPSEMYKAIHALDSLPEVNPFSSFYDIFLPASVNHIFTNKPTLTLTYDESVTDPYALNVYFFNEAQGVYTIENNNRRIDPVNHKISVSIGHASVFTVLASSESIIRGSAFSGEVEVFNFPNPFDLKLKPVTLQNPGTNPASQQIKGTMIKVSLPDNVFGTVEIQIFNLSGDKVRTISANAPVGGSHYYIEWDGANDHGKEVASGIYIGRLRVAGANEKFFKMAVVK